LIYMVAGSVPPDGFARVGSYRQSLSLDAGPARVLTIVVYQKVQ